MDYEEYKIKFKAIQYLSILTDKQKKINTTGVYHNSTQLGCTVFSLKKGEYNGFAYTLYHKIFTDTTSSINKRFYFKKKLYGQQLIYNM